MTQMLFTERSVRKLKAPDPSGQQKLYWDSGFSGGGFGVLVSGSSNTKTFVVRGTVRDGRAVRKAIERVGLISVEDARRRAERMLVEFHGGIDPRRSKAASITLGGALELYLTARADLKPRSKEEYRAIVNRHLGSWLSTQLKSIDRNAVENRHRQIATEVEQHHAAAAKAAARRHLSRAEKVEDQWPEAAVRHRARWKAAQERKPYSGFATANSAMRALRAIWNFMLERGADLPANPVKLRRQWHPVEPRTRHVSGDDLSKFYSALALLPNQIAADYIRLMLFTGLRRREASSLQWKDLDLNSKTMCVPMTKSGRPLKLPLSAIVHDLLVARRQSGDTKYVFPAPSKAGYIQSPKFYFRQIAEATGIRVSPHDLRRTYITAAESADISPFALKALVNHSLGNDVTSGYIQMSAERLREPAQRVADRLKQLCGIVEPQGANITKMR
jgi:integrase